MGRGEAVTRTLGGSHRARHPPPPHTPRPPPPAQPLVTLPSPRHAPGPPAARSLSGRRRFLPAVGFTNSLKLLRSCSHEAQREFSGPPDFSRASAIVKTTVVAHLAAGKSAVSSLSGLLRRLVFGISAKDTTF